MSKKWTQREIRDGNVVDPDGFNEEIKAAASSIQTLDRTQFPAACVDDTNLKTNALHQVWAYPIYPTNSGTEGEQTNVRDTNARTNAWQAVTYQLYAGGWQTLGSPISLTGFKGGSLFVEWSGNAYCFPAFTNTYGADFPGNPKYMRLRIIVDGVIMVERLGTALIEHFRVIGTGQFPPGDLQVQLQWQATNSSVNDALETKAGGVLTQAHVCSSKVLIIGRAR